MRRWWLSAAGLLILLSLPIQARATDSVKGLSPEILAKIKLLQEDLSPEQAVSAMRDVLNALEQSEKWAAEGDPAVESELCFLLASELVRAPGDREAHFEEALGQIARSLALLGESAPSSQKSKRYHLEGVLYDERTGGRKAENQERALEAFEQALAHTSKQGAPYQWATTRKSLGVVYQDRVLGDRSANLDRSLEAFAAVMEVEEWRQSHQLGLGFYLIGESNCLYPRPAPGRLDRAIEAYRSAIEVLPAPEQSPWALASRQRLADALLNRALSGDPASIEPAMAAYEELGRRATGDEDYAISELHRLAAHGYAFLRGSIGFEELPLADAIGALQNLPPAEGEGPRTDRSHRPTCLERSLPQALRLASLTLSRLEAEKGSQHELLGAAAELLREAMRERLW